MTSKHYNRDLEFKIFNRMKIKLAANPMLLIFAYDYKLNLSYNSLCIDKLLNVDTMTYEKTGLASNILGILTSSCPEFQERGRRRWMWCNGQTRSTGCSSDSQL